MNLSKADFQGQRVLRGRRIVCASTGEVHYEGEEIATFEFVDYSWVCHVCGKLHCSMCWYSTDGETITVTDCGRFGDKTYEEKA